MSFTLPDIAISRDGQRAILVNSVDYEWYQVENRHAHARYVEVRVAARLPLVTLKLIATGEIAAYWNMPEQRYRWKDVDFNTAFPELAVIAIGEYLDDAPVPQQPPETDHAAVVWPKSHLLDLFAREPEQDDARLLRYIGGKLYWGYKLGLETIALGRHDALRFGISAQDFHHLALQGLGVLWDRVAAGSYRPTPRLLTDFRAGAIPGLERPPIEQVAETISRERYPAAVHHIEQAVGYLRATNADLANAAKEAVSAVESVCKVLLNEPNATLGECVKELRKQQLVPREIARMLESLWAYRSTTPGVGHGGTSVPSVSEAEAQLMTGMSAQLIAYLDSLWTLTAPRRSD